LFKNYISVQPNLYSDSLTCRLQFNMSMHERMMLYLTMLKESDRHPHTSQIRAS